MGVLVTMRQSRVCPTHKEGYRNPKMINQILLDMDDVLINWTDGTCEALGVPNPYPTTPSRGNWHLEDVLGISKDHMWEQLNKIPGYWAGLKPNPEAHELINLCASKVGMDNVGILTATAMRPNTIIGKHKCIHKYFPQLEDRVIIGRAKEFCAGPHRLLIDDKDLNIKAFRAAGGQGITFPRYHNEEHKWHDVAIQKVREALEQL